jgi:hypothetical protein
VVPAEIGVEIVVTDGLAIGVRVAVVPMEDAPLDKDRVGLEVDVGTLAAPVSRTGTAGPSALNRRRRPSSLISPSPPKKRESNHWLARSD